MGEESESILSSLNKRQNEFNVIKTRIDTEDLLDRIELYLRGARLVTIQDDTGVRSKNIKFGVAKANEQGIQSILNWLSMTINPHTVQGNFPSDRTGYSKQFSDFIFYFRLDLGEYLMINLENFDIKLYEYQGIIDSILFLLEPFMSRCIDNLERQSYSETTRSVESNVVKAKGGLGILN